MTLNDFEGQYLLLWLNGVRQSQGCY